jgi:hypothetical protein
MQLPFAREMNNGEPPTECQARTGLLTPPGIFFNARAKKIFDREIIGGECW